MQKQNNEIQFPVVRFLSLLIFLSVFFLPALSVFVTDAEARMINDEAEIRYLLRRKFMLAGELSATYEQYSTKTGDSPEIKQYSLAEELRLKFKSYVYHPAILTYTAELDLLNSSGDYGRGNIRSYALGLDFFRRKPLKFSLRAGYIDAADYTLNSQGFSVSYTRARQQLVFSSMREASRYMDIQQYIQKKAAQQTSKNTADGEDEDSNNNGQSNSQDNIQKNDQAAPPNIKTSRQLNFFDNIAPVHIYLDWDRYDYNTSFGASNNIVSYFTSARFLGIFLTADTTTSYHLNLEYQNINENGDLQEKYKSAFYLRTNFKDSSRFTLDTRYRIEDGPEYSSKDLFTTARYEGFFMNKKWNYTVAAFYDWAENDTHISSRYMFSADARSRMNYGRVQVTHLIGLKYDRGNQDSNYAVFGREDAALPVNNRLTVGGSVGFDLGSSVRAFDAEARSRYLLSRRSFLTASYRYTNFSGNRVSSDSFISSTISSSSYISHAFRLGYTAAFDKFSFDSSVQYNIYDEGNALAWDTLFNTTLFNRVSFSLGARLTRENGIGATSVDFGLTNVQPLISGEETLTYMSLYNTIAVSPFRNALFRLYSTYQKKLGGVKSEAYGTNPNFQWRLRKLYVSLDYRYSVETQDALRTREQRVLLRVSRPFWL